MSATSSMAQGFAQNVQDFINNPQMFEQTYSDTNKTIEFEKNIITAYGNIKEYTPQDLPEFQSRSINSKRDILDSSNDIFSQASIKFVNGIRDYTREDMLRYKDEGVKLIFFNDGVYELDKYEDILPNNKKDFSLFDAYSPDDMIKIQEYYEKFYGPIVDNPNLTEKQKFHAAMQVLRCLNTYDTTLLNETPNRVEKLNVANGQYGSIKYGKLVCGGYADSVKKICGMLDIDCKEILVWNGNRKKFNNLSAEQKNSFALSLKQNTPLDTLNHAINMITFKDGSTYLLDMSKDDYSRENSSKKKYNTTSAYLTNSSKFETVYQYSKGKFLTFLPEHRDLSNCDKIMSRKEIQNDLEIAMEELPYIKKLTELDKFQRENNLTKEKASILFKARNYISKLKDTLFPSKHKMLAEAKTDYAYDNNLGSDLKKQNSDFRDMISNNGKYQKIIEDYHKTIAARDSSYLKEVRDYKVKQDESREC